MWVRIQEISFPAEEADRVIAHVRDSTVARYAGESCRGSRLLVDRAGGTALDVSYWQDERGARGHGNDPAEGRPMSGVDPSGVPGVAVLRTRCYELAVDAG